MIKVSEGPYYDQHFLENVYELRERARTLSIKKL